METITARLAAKIDRMWNTKGLDEKVLICVDFSGLNLHQIARALAKKFGVPVWCAVNFVEYVIESDADKEV